MNIAIIGTGNMATPLARYFAQANHRVFIGSRDENRAKQKAAELGFGIKGSSIKSAEQEADVVFLAVPYTSMKQTLNETGSMTEKTVVDMSNYFSPDFKSLAIANGTSAAEEVAKLIPQANVVKAFNTVFATVLQKGLDFKSQTLNIFVASNDEAAKTTVSKLISSIGLKPVNCGELSSAQYMESLAALILQIDSHLENGIQIVPAILERGQLAA